MTFALLRDRALALAVLLVAVGLFLALAVWPGFRAESVARAKARDLSGTIALAERRMAGTGIDGSRLTDLVDRLAVHPAIQPPDDAGLTVARLQSELRQIVETAGGLPSQTSAGEVDDEDGLPMQPLRVQFTGNDAVLRDVLHALEFARPDLRLTALSIRPLRTRDPAQYLAFDMSVVVILPTDAEEGDT